MKLRIKLAAIALFCLATVILFSGCAFEEPPYVTNNEENYTVSVKYDANGGLFTTSTSVIVDSYNPDELPVGENGKAEIALLAPEDEDRNDSFTPSKNGYFFAGWYQTRTEKKDANGKATYTYSDKWDFDEDRLEIDPKKEYLSEEPVITLYAAWVPLFELKVYDIESGEEVSTVKFDPRTKTEFTLPSWNEKTGAMDMHDIPERNEFTYEKAYLDKEMTSPVEGTVFTHPGKLDYETATAEDSVVSLYVDWKAGEWFRIETAEQFIDNASITGCYEILADLDFEGLLWPTALTFNDFKGEIAGNGHTLKNISFTQTANDKNNIGIFGNITDSARMSDVTFENVTLCLKKGTRINTNFGILAGTIGNDAEMSNVNLINSTLQIDSDCYFAGGANYAIGLVCGMGDAAKVTSENVTCVAVGADTSKYTISTDGNTVSVELDK